MYARKSKGGIINWASVSERHTSRSLARGAIWCCTTYIMYVCRSVSHTDRYRKSGACNTTKHCIHFRMLYRKSLACVRVWHRDYGDNTMRSILNYLPLYLRSGDSKDEHRWWTYLFIDLRAVATCTCPAEHNHHWCAGPVCSMHSYRFCV